ncbi:MAG: phosphoribosyl-AMP cyclohydrolase [Alphaproteobacteria bacterium]
MSIDHVHNINQATLDALAWNEQGLLPAIAQCADTGKVLMLAWVNKQSLALSIEKKLAVYWSRSRRGLWIKGETSGHYQHLQRIDIDCDSDAILFTVKQVGPACHTGALSCFFSPLAVFVAE